MSFTTAHNSVTPAQSQSFVPSSEKPKKRGLAASWFKVDGRLVCKWFPVED